MLNGAMISRMVLSSQRTTTLWISSADMSFKRNHSNLSAPAIDVIQEAYEYVIPLNFDEK